MNNIDLINEIFFLKNLKYTKLEIADRLNGILYDMAIDYYTSADADDYLDEECKEYVQNEVSEIEKSLENFLIEEQVEVHIRNTIKNFWEQYYKGE